MVLFLLLYCCCSRPFCATFLNFIGYALGAVRVSALSNMGIIYVMTHDSIGLGKWVSGSAITTTSTITIKYYYDYY